MHPIDIFVRTVTLSSKQNNVKDNCHGKKDYDAGMGH